MNKVDFKGMSFICPLSRSSTVGANQISQDLVKYVLRSQPCKDIKSAGTKLIMRPRSSSSYVISRENYNRYRPFCKVCNIFIETLCMMMLEQ